jgi:hypothetical protein
MRFTRSIPSRRLTTSVAIAAFISSLAAFATPASAQQLFADEFNTTSFNSGNWGVYESWQSLQRTQFGLTPTIGSESGVSYARMPLRTYNSAYNSSTPRTQGTEIYTKQYFPMGTGIEFEARVRGVNMPRGVVFSLYGYSEKGVWPSGYLKDEIDFEILTNKPTNQYWSNIWNDWNSRYGYNDGVHNADQLLTVSGMNYTAWTTYTARWYPDRTEFYVNGILTRTAKTAVPDDALNVHFNVWNPDSSWGTAYDAAMKPTNNSGQNVQCFMDVDYVRVKKLPAPTKGVWSDGSGLAAEYFPQANLTGTPVKRVDPRIYNDWQAYSPDINIPNDNFSARWSGAISSPFTENVTFTLRADDGVRLYIDNKLVINDWRAVSATDRTVTVAMKAGVKVPIKVEYYEGTGGASCMLHWSSPSMPKTIVPQSQLFPTAIVADTVAPAVTITAPVAGYSYRSISAAGTASDAGGIATVRATVRRLSDNFYWNGTAWVAAASQINATLSGANWTLPMSFLTHGRYTIAATATDKAGNATTTPAREFWIDTMAPTVTITTPANGSSLTTLTAPVGNANDAGPGVASVSLALMRSRDGYWWNGSTFISTYTEVKATVSGTTWKYTLPSPAAGAYIIHAMGIDYVGNVGSWTQSNFQIVSGARTTAAVTGPTVTTTPSSKGF